MKRNKNLDVRLYLREKEMNQTKNIFFQTILKLLRKR